MFAHRIIILCFSSIFYSTKIDGGKTATKVGLAGIATVGVGSTGGYQTEDSYTRVTGTTSQKNKPVRFKNELERLKFNLFVTGHYDKSLRPVKDPKHITTVALDFTLRQILDLDEKNQVLKTYIWNRQRWTDEFLVWNETEYNGIKTMWVPANSVWRPDIVMYEDTGVHDYNPRMPYNRVTSEGRVSATEPIVIETTCGIDIALFPFDYQLCSTTFLSWTFPSSKVDLIASKTPKAIMNDIELYSLKTGEWTIQDVIVVKTSESFQTLQETVENASDNKDCVQNTSNIRKMTLDPMKRVEIIFPDRITDIHWSDIKYTFVLRRNSSIYMQSMLFPAILLTTVALLGFYLPPDSGERIGLQITILLTFMVFLLTVGEMFPASTGPFLGVYYVMCMALLGVNIFMTVLVLHLHYMPSAAVLGVKEGGDMQIKAVPKWVQILLRIANFQFRKNPKNGRNSPTSQIVLNIVRTGHLSAKVNNSDEENHDNDDAVLVKDQVINKKKDATTQQDESYVICTNKTTITSNSKVSPTNNEYDDNTSEVASDVESGNAGSYKSTSSNYGSIRQRHIGQHCVNNDSDRHSNNENHHSNNFAINPIYTKLSKNMNQILKYLKAQNQHLRESDMSDEIENEWKAMARTIDHLCMKLYIAILIISHVIILGAALIQSADHEK